MAAYKPGRPLDDYESDKFEQIVDANTTSKGRLRLVWVNPGVAKAMSGTLLEEALLLSFGTLWRE